MRTLKEKFNYNYDQRSAILRMDQRENWSNFRLTDDLMDVLRDYLDEDDYNSLLSFYRRFNKWPSFSWDAKADDRGHGKVSFQKTANGEKTYLNDDLCYALQEAFDKAIEDVKEEDAKYKKNPLSIVNTAVRFCKQNKIGIAAIGTVTLLIAGSITGAEVYLKSTEDIRNLVNAYMADITDVNGNSLSRGTSELNQLAIGWLGSDAFKLGLAIKNLNGTYQKTKAFIRLLAKEAEKNGTTLTTEFKKVAKEEGIDIVENLGGGEYIIRVTGEDGVSQNIQLDLSQPMPGTNLRFYYDENKRRFFNRLLRLDD